MRISRLLDRPVLLLGGGREGQATRALLRARGHAGRIAVLSDAAPTLADPELSWIPPAALDAELAGDPVVIRSPGFAPTHPLRRRLDAWGGAQTTATRIALAELRAAAVPVIGVTASKGKSTISSLIHRLLADAGRPVTLVGNIGIPVLSRLDAILAARHQVVMELSSYQCDDLAPGEGPEQVVLGSLFPEHLDWHGSLAAYYGAKSRLPASAPAGAHVHLAQRSAEVLAAHRLDAPLRRADLRVELVHQPAGLHLSGTWLMDGARPLLDLVAMRLPGQHNRENACLAYAAVRGHGVDLGTLDRVLRSFEGLPYRLQDEGLHAGVRWINDSISTAPEAACAGLEAFAGAVATLIAGGQDRGYDYRPLADALLRAGVPELIVLPDSGAAIAEAVASHPGRLRLRIHEAGNLAEAVAVAAQVTPPGRVCLFSPAAPSYHAWSDFEARGRDFHTLVQALHRS